MNTKLLMAASAMVMGVVGAAGLFAPHELLSALGITATEPLPALVQLHGALLFGFAMVNWMAKDSLIGGIYNRPVAVGNLMHFATGAITLVKLVMTGTKPMPILIATAIYTIFAIGFAMIVFGSPIKAAQPIN